MIPKQSAVTATLIGNVDDIDHHAQILVDYLVLAMRFICIVAFARKSGFEMISDVIRKRIVSGMSATFVVGIDFYQTEPDLILDLMKLGKLSTVPDNVKVYMGAENAKYTMHPKVYVIGAADATTAIVGSANMTYGGLADNWELSALIRSRDVDWEIGLSKWIQDRVEDGEIIAANVAAVERYKIMRDIYLAHMKMAEKRARRAVNSPRGDLDTLRAILATMRADESDEGFNIQVARRAASLRKGPVILRRIADLKTPSPTDFLIIYEELLSEVWHSGGLHRGKRVIASEPIVFRDALKALNRSGSGDPRVLYDLILKYMDRVSRAGVNVITEILHSRDFTRFPVMNRNSVSGMRLASLVGYPDPLTKKTVDGVTYARFCADAERIRADLKLKNFSELDAVFNYAYWRTDKSCGKSPSGALITNA